jgi:hypothetical protein
MEAVVVDAGSKLLKAGIALPDQAPALVSARISPAHLEGAEFRAFFVWIVVEFLVLWGICCSGDALEDEAGGRGPAAGRRRGGGGGGAARGARLCQGLGRHGGPAQLRPVPEHRLGDWRRGPDPLHRAALHAQGDGFPVLL